MPVDKITTTIGLNVLKFVRAGCEIKLWDMGGAEHLRPLWKDYFCSSHALLFVVKENDDDRFSEIKQEISHLDNDSDLDDVPLVLVVNYENDPPSMDKYRALSSLCKTRKFICFAVNCASGEGLNQCIDELLQYLKQHARSITEDDFV